MCCDYCLDEFTPAPKPTEEERAVVPLHKRKLPPWNGFGTFEDSAQNCVTVEPKQIMRDFKKFLTLDRFSKIRLIISQSQLKIAMNHISSITIKYTNRIVHLLTV